MTNNTVPVMASGVCPFPPKYTAAAMLAAESDNTATTAAWDGLPVPILLILVITNNE
jgi:hypothetical protein